MRVDDIIDPGGRTWKSGHALLERGAPDLFVAAELFDVFLAARDGTGPGSIFFNHEIERNVFARQHGEPTPEERIPRGTDRSFAGYSARMKELLSDAGDTRFCLRVTELHAYAAPIYRRLCALLAPLEELLVEQSRGIRTTVFVGDYDYTPFGVHVDPYPQIQCTIEGTKTALFWSSEYWKDRSHAERLAPWNHLGAAVQAQVATNDAVYWAGDYEHAFSSKSGFSIALTISFPNVPPPESPIDAARRRAAHQFLNVPNPRPATTAARFRGDPMFPLAIAGVEDTHAIVVGSGAAFAFPRAPATEALVARVNEGAPFGSADLPLPEDEADAMIAALYTHHCIDVA